MVRRKNENVPLLLDEGQTRQRIISSAHQMENGSYDGDTVSDGRLSFVERDPEAKLKEKKGSGRQIIVLDIAFIFLEYLQYFALLQSLSLRWTWPLTWTRAMSFLFLFNVDAWEFAKVTSGSYTAARNAFVASDDVPVNYRVMLLVMVILAVVTVCLAAFGLIARKIFTTKLWYRSILLLWNRIADKVTLAFIFGIQALALPIGVQLSKLFWCLPASNVMDVENSVQCWSGEHIVYVVLSILIAAVLYIGFPVWLALKINKEVISSNAGKHEAYLQLKHCERVLDLDTSWNDRLFLTFASYNRFWVYHRPLHHVFKFIVLCWYATLFNHRLVQASLIFAFLLLHFFLTVVKFPYRVTSLNLPYLWSLLCLICCAVIGAMQNIDGLQNAFLLPSYIEGELILINSAWIVGMVLYVVYFILRDQRVICASTPLWPTMLHHGMDGLNKNTKRYMVAAVKGRHATQKALRFPALLAPVHELAHHIQVVNALAREAEYIDDPLHSSLRDVLEDLVELHGKLVHQSIFAESLKVKVQSTVDKLVEVLPAFSRRLRQRQFDLILVPPLRRRMLLKMFAVSCFLRSSSRDERPHEHGVRKLWSAPPDHRYHSNYGYDEGFHEGEQGSVLDLDNIELNENQGRPAESVNSYESYPYQAEDLRRDTTEV